MSQATIPNINPSIHLPSGDVIQLLLISIGMEELSLSHIINSESEKLQYVLGTLPGVTPPGATISDVLRVNKSVRRVLQAVINKQCLLSDRIDTVVRLML